MNISHVAQFVAEMMLTLMLGFYANSTDTSTPFMVYILVLLIMVVLI